MVMFHLVSSKAIINSIHVIIKYFLNKKLSVICIWELKWSSFVLPGPRGGNFHQASCVWIWEPAQAQRLQFWSGTTCLSPNKTKIVNFLMIYMLFIYSLLNYLLRKTKKCCSYLGKNSVAERADIQNLLQFEGTIQDSETQKFGEWVQNGLQSNLVMHIYTISFNLPQLSWECIWNENWLTTRKYYKQTK